MATHSNNLIHETSPYLLQHAHNPVNWHPWSKDILRIAQQENKPILISIGYSACHWCHVMERESFEDEPTAAIMNEHFINIKIDREERPDLDHIYMDAVQAMTGSGGWPLNVFLTPQGKPFYGGTYFPLQKAFNRPSWQDVLISVSQTFREKRNEIDAQAEKLTEHLMQANSFGLQQLTGEEQIYSKEKFITAFKNIMKTADKEWGGFGRAPKFPQTFTIQYLLRYYAATKKEEALVQALLSLDKMIEGGLYDQVGGGFARYSTDTEWLVPHFEKMLYDNALLISVLSEAYQLSKKDQYKEVIDETMEFVGREMSHQLNGFYAALDADSEGEEGKFYAWNYEEVKEILGKDAAIFCDYCDITRGGNWEGKNIPRIKKTRESFAPKNNTSVAALKQLVEKGKKKLLIERSKRIRPGLDDKIILGWNALMNTAASKAFAATGNERYKQLAIDNMNFLLQKFKIDDSEELFHTWKDEQGKYPAFLDDYAYLIQALIHLQEITADAVWLNKAKAISSFVIANFSEEDTGFFFYTKKGQADIIVRKKEVYDGAVPSGNAVMAYNLYHLSVLLDEAGFKKLALKMTSSLGNAVIKYPGSFGVWASLMLEMATGTSEIAITGLNYQPLLKEVLAAYIPQRVLTAANKPSNLALLNGKPVEKQNNIWLCRNYMCHQPVQSVLELITLIDSGKAAN